MDLEVTAHDDGGRFWFTFAGLSGENPDLHLEPGAVVQVRFHNAGTVAHNFRVEGSGIACCVPPGGDATGSFVVPAHDSTYLCEPHQDLQMRGRILTGSPTKGSAAPWAATLAALLVAAGWSSLDPRRPR